MGRSSRRIESKNIRVSVSHRLFQVGIPLREFFGIGLYRVEIACFEPLPGKIFRKCGCPRIREHAR